jgi:hypothetical protein
VPFPSLHSAKSIPKKKKKAMKPSRDPVIGMDDQEGSDGPTEMQTNTQPTESAEPNSSFLQFQTQRVGTSAAFTGDHYRKPSASQDDGPLTAPSTTIQFQVTAPSPSRLPPRQIHSLPQSLQPSPSNIARMVRPKSRHPHGGSVPVTPLTSDARSEHLLLAARKIGRERAGIVAGYIRDRKRDADAQKEHEREREVAVREMERSEREQQERPAERVVGGLSYYRTDSLDGVVASPKTPKRGSGGHYPSLSGGSGSGSGIGIQSPQPLNPTSALVDPRQTMRHGIPARRTVPESVAVDPILTTPRQGGSSSGSQNQPGQNTPLASLIDAARMMDDGDKGATGRVNGDGRRRSAEAIGEPETPVPKRRKVGRRAGSTVVGRDAGDDQGGRGLGSVRMKSALDVLADQAAAFSSAGNGKEKEKELAAPDGVAPKAKRKVKATEKAREKDKEKAKPVTARKPRARPPPKERKLAPAPTVDDAVPVDSAPAVGKAAPRMISPPRPRPYQGMGVAGPSQTISNDRVSPLDMLPPTKKALHPPRKEPRSSEVQSRSMGEVIVAPSRPDSRFGFRPVTRWGRPGSDEEEEGGSGSPLRVVGESASRRGSQRQRQGPVSEAPFMEEESRQNVSHERREAENDMLMAVDTRTEVGAPGTNLPSQLESGGDAPVVTEEAIEGIEIEQDLRTEGPDVEDRHNALSKPPDVSESPGVDETKNLQRVADMQESINPQCSVENSGLIPGNEDEVEPMSDGSQGLPGEPESYSLTTPASPAKNNSPLSGSRPLQFLELNPHEDADVDADADADEDEDAEGEVDADGDVDPDAEGDVDLGTESAFSVPASRGTLSVDIDERQLAVYPSNSLVSPLDLLNDQCTETQLYNANASTPLHGHPNGLFDTLDASSDSVLRPFPPGDSHS